MKKASKLIFVTLSKRQCWGFFNRRNEALLWELAKKESVERVLHIEFISLRQLLSHFKQWIVKKDLALKMALQTQVKKGISLKPLAASGNPGYYIFSLVELYAGNSPYLRRISDFFKAIQYKRINLLLEQSAGTVTLIAYPPFRALPESIKRIKHDILIADVVDDDIEMTDDPEKKKEFLENYKEVLPKCAWVFSTSGALTEKYGRYAKQEIHLLPNGVDVGEYPAADAVKYRKREGRKVVGYVGVINKAMDTEMLEHLLSRFTAVDFVLIGLYRADQLPTLKRLTESYGNFIYLGERNYRDVPGYLRSFDVLINFKKADYTTAGNDSMKIYQYLATGHPIVATPMSPAEQFREVIYVAYDKYQFADHLANALKEDNPLLKVKRIEEAMKNSWAGRAEIILKKVSGIAGKKKADLMYAEEEQRLKPADGLSGSSSMKAGNVSDISGRIVCL